MITLYESILNSTKSGKNVFVLDEFLKTLAEIKKQTNGEIICNGNETPVYLPNTFAHTYIKMNLKQHYSILYHKKDDKKATDCLEKYINKFDFNVYDGDNINSPIKFNKVKDNSIYKFNYKIEDNTEDNAYLNIILIKINGNFIVLNNITYKEENDVYELCIFAIDSKSNYNSELTTKIAIALI